MLNKFDASKQFFQVSAQFLSLRASVDRSTKLILAFFQAAIPMKTGIVMVNSPYNLVYYIGLTIKSNSEHCLSSA